MLTCQPRRSLYLCRLSEGQVRFSATMNSNETTTAAMTTRTFWVTVSIEFRASYGGLKARPPESTFRAGLASGTEFEPNALRPSRKDPAPGCYAYEAPENNVAIPAHTVA